MLEWEEDAGKAWDRFLRKKTTISNKQAQVEFQTLSKQLKIFYHLLGGDKGKELKITDKRDIKKSITFLQKISGYGKSFFLTWQDEDAIYFPPKLDILPTKEENIMLYFWLVAMATNINVDSSNMIDENQKVSKYLCDKYTGFNTFYIKAKKYLISKIPELVYIDEKNIEFDDNYPFIMWIYPSLNKNSKLRNSYEEESQSQRKDEKTESLKMKKKAKQIDDKKKTDGFMAFIPEGMMSILEQVNVDRAEDDSFDEDALYNAQDLDEITLGQKKANLNSRLKMDLDIKASINEEYPIGRGHFLDEWDYTKKTYLKNYVRIKPIISVNTEEIPLPKRLQKTVKKIQSELDLLEINRFKNNHLPYGDEICIDTWIDYKGHQNKSLHHQKFYENFEKKTRDMATLILADISLSTEAGITQEIRVIDMIKDGLMVFSQALEKLEDKFAIYAFSSNKNTNVKFHIIKNFKEKYSNLIRGRIEAIKPGYYTRLGAAIRESTKILNKQQNQNKLLLIISDGKPNDIDRYDGRYGIEDTKKAIEEVKQKGITPFCITIDIEAKDYLSYLFGKNGYAVVRDSKKLPKIMPEVYINLTK
ncbi:nitric oxide reductase activation protein NorD [Arcobacter arenosus]|uniref:VWA domain-containing protein n=1 Tax=Arcobacter arenosus TaxID=2576037 RepID=A0A5R8Y4I6_9BACT|nr:VWA domain-containing protein [Arcobacter arenosus]TLP40878.1 VWA domain-containing protein [Arcobacter arenosus]